MKIPVDSDYRLASDALCWKVEKRTTCKGQDIWQPISWHDTPGGAAKSLSRRLVRLCEAETLEDALKAVDEIADKLTRALTPRLSFEDVR